MQESNSVRSTDSSGWKYYGCCKRLWTMAYKIVILICVVLRSVVSIDLSHSVNTNNVEKYITGEASNNVIFGNSVTETRFTGSCRTQFVVQKVRRRGCVPATVPNNICSGECASFTAPEILLKSGNFLKQNIYRQCFPQKIERKRVLLFCPGRNRIIQTKKVLYVNTCKCTTVW